jgi:hypothetical protein
MPSSQHLGARADPAFPCQDTNFQNLLGIKCFLSCHRTVLCSSLYRSIYTYFPFVKRVPDFEEGGPGYREQPLAVKRFRSLPGDVSLIVAHGIHPVSKTFQAIHFLRKPRKTPRKNVGTPKAALVCLVAATQTNSGCITKSFQAFHLLPCLMSFNLICGSYTRLVKDEFILLAVLVFRAQIYDRK